MQVFTVCDYKGLCLRSVSSSYVLRSAEGIQHAVESAKGGTRSEPYNNAFSFTPGKQFEKQKHWKTMATANLHCMTSPSLIRKV